MDTYLPIDISTVFMFEHFHDRFFTKQQPYQPTSERLSLGVKRRLSDMSKLILLLSHCTTYTQTGAGTHRDNATNTQTMLVNTSLNLT